MPKTPKVSVIITMYNEERYIRKCLESLLAQTYQNLEVILVDNACSDGTVEIAKKFPFRIITKKINEGPGPARNLGAKEAKGEILVLVDADMEFDRDYVKHLVQPIIDGKCIGTAHMIEKVANKENIWARCWGMRRANPEMSWERIGIFRAVLKENFLKTGGFNPKKGYFDDGSAYERTESGLPVKEAICYHNNPSSLKEVFNHSKWIGGSMMIDYQNLLNLKFFLTKPRRAKRFKFLAGLLVLWALLSIAFFRIWGSHIGYKTVISLIIITPPIILILLFTLVRTMCEGYAKYIISLPVFYMVKFLGLASGAVEQLPGIITNKIHGKEIVYKYHIKNKV